MAVAKRERSVEEILERCHRILLDGPAPIGDLALEARVDTARAVEAMAREPGKYVSREFHMGRHHTTLWLLRDHAEAWGVPVEECAGPC